MEGASGDDWIACAQSMRAYLRFSLLGGIVAEQIRRLGYTARVHTVVDGEVLQPPLLLLSGLGEVSRIGEVILNPYLGPRLKSGTITTNLPLAHDRPVDFGLCSTSATTATSAPASARPGRSPRAENACSTATRSGSPTARSARPTGSPSLGGAMCGRCMKTCPWNLEGLFAEAPFRWAASRVPRLARHLAALDDRLKRGSINPVKKWWWDLGDAERRTVPARGAARPPAHAATRTEARPGRADTRRVSGEPGAAPLSVSVPHGSRGRHPGARGTGDAGRVSPPAGERGCRTDRPPIHGYRKVRRRYWRSGSPTSSR